MPFLEDSRAIQSLRYGLQDTHSLRFLHPPNPTVLTAHAMSYEAEKDQYCFVKTHVEELTPGDSEMP